MRGRVVIGSDSEAPSGSFVGVMKLSNNTAEMQAVVETLPVILAQVEADAKQEPEAKVAREQDEGEPKAKAKARSLRREHLGDLLMRAFLDGA